MACERYGEALADVAAGLPAPAGLEAHLATCAMCREELHVLRQALAMADAEMAGLAIAEPTPGLAARIRQAVAAADPSPAWRFGWLWPATAAAAALLVGLAVVLGRSTPPTDGPRVAVDGARPQAQPRAPREAAERGGSAGTADSASPGLTAAPRSDRVGKRDDHAPARSHPAGGRRTPAEPEVMVPPGEAETLMRFVARVHRDRLAPTSFAAAGEPSADLAELALIDIPPLEIVPLDPAEVSGT
jgi:hypothetical protein